MQVERPNSRKDYTSTLVNAVSTGAIRRRLGLVYPLGQIVQAAFRQFRSRSRVLLFQIPERPILFHVIKFIS